MSVLAYYFGWPDGQVWGNLIASVICAGAAWWRLRARMITHHLEVLAQHERHHLEQLAYLTASAGGAGGRVTGCCQAPLWRNRCARCGHRQPVGGVPPQATRRRPPWLWPGELLGRWQARRQGRG